MPIAKTKRSQTLTPEKTTRLFSAQPFGVAKTTGTPTINAKDNKIKANNES
jgi:hypothetical protein